MARQRTALREPNNEGMPNEVVDWPGWMPVATRNYLAYVERGRTLREIAAEGDVHPSTILRRIRRVEGSREDPLLDAALRRVARPDDAPASEDREDGIVRDALLVLRKLADPEAVLAVSRDLEKGAVMRSGPDGEPQRLAVVDKGLAQEMTVRGWIACCVPDARVQRYRITAPGRALLRRAGGARPGPGLGESPARFAGAGEPEDPAEEARRRVYRFAAAESPLAALSRRRGKGSPFLPRDLWPLGTACGRTSSSPRANPTIGRPGSPSWDGSPGSRRCRSFRTARNRRAGGWSGRSSNWGPTLPTSPCGPAASSRASSTSRSGRAGRRGPPRSSSRSRLNGFASITGHPGPGTGS